MAVLVASVGQRAKGEGQKGEPPLGSSAWRGQGADPLVECEMGGHSGPNLVLRGRVPGMLLSSYSTDMMGPSPQGCF